MDSTLNCNLRILFWNCRSISAHKSELHHMLIDVDIFVAVEPWLKPNIRFNHPGFHEVREDRIDRLGGGIIFLIRNNLKYTRSNARSRNSFEVCTVKITNVLPPLNLTACYRAPNTNPTQLEWDNLFSIVNSSETHLFMGDFNAHSISWKCARDDCSGNRLSESISDTDLLLLNTNTSTQVDAQSGNLSNLDLIFSTNDIADKTEVEVGRYLGLRSLPHKNNSQRNRQIMPALGSHQPQLHATMPNQPLPRQKLHLH